MAHDLVRRIHVEFFDKTQTVSPARNTITHTHTETHTLHLDHGYRRQVVGGQF